jgi:hypothetical protein
MSDQPPTRWQFLLLAALRLDTTLFAVSVKYQYPFVVTTSTIVCYFLIWPYIPTRYVRHFTTSCFLCLVMIAAVNSIQNGSQIEFCQISSRIRPSYDPPIHELFKRPVSQLWESIICVKYQVFVRSNMSTSRAQTESTKQDEDERYQRFTKGRLIMPEEDVREVRRVVQSLDYVWGRLQDATIPPESKSSQSDRESDA